MIRHMIYGNLVSELKSNLQDTVDWGRKWLADFSARKTLTGLI